MFYDQKVGLEIPLPSVISPRPAPSKPAPSKPAVLPAGHTGTHTQAVPAEPDTARGFARPASPVDALELADRPASRKRSMVVGALISGDL